MQTEPAHAYLSHGDELLSEIYDVVSMLPGSTIDDFLNAQPLSTFPSLSGRGWQVFDCKMEDGRIEPLQPADSDHLPWDELCVALDAAGSWSAALALPEHLVLLIESGLESPARILVIPDSDIVRVLQSSGDDEQPTSSELRLLKQLVCGMGLSEAGKVDGVSHETKRTQYKSLSRKLTVHSQNELTNKVLTRLLFGSHISVNDNTMQVDEYFIELVRDFIPSARCFQLFGTEGKRYRFVDIGPVTGRPVAFVHPMILPDIRQNDVALLHDQNLRLIIPLRHGAMSKATAHLSIADHIDHACEGIDLVRTHFAGDKLDLILCISGCAYGIEYARRHPDRVRSLALVGACARPLEHPGVSGRLRTSLLTLASANWRAYSAILLFFCRRICQPKTLRRLLHQYYRPSSADFAIVEAEYSAFHGGERGRKLFAASVESMVHDFYHQGLLRWQELPCGRFPVAFFHGDQDAIHKIEDVRALAESLGAVPVYAIPKAGQLLYYGHFQSLLTVCSTFFTNPVNPTEQ